jgi:quercetin 2,3-dioxygenase
MKLRTSAARGHANHGWLESYHTFSFASYHDPQFMGFRSLRVINEDFVQKSMGFGTHSHKDMEIITYVLEGALEHKDSMGNNSIIYAGDVQRLSAGTGITHSEFNHSSIDLVHLLQIWILPDRLNISPSYDQKAFSHDQKIDQLRLIVSQDGRENSIAIQQDVNIYAGIITPKTEIIYTIPPNRYAWLQVAQGEVYVNGQSLTAGDAIACETDLNTAQTLTIRGTAEILIFDLA